MQPIKCPETGNIIDPAKTDIYAYARDLYHLPDKGPNYFLKGWRHENPDVIPRVRLLMQAAVTQQAERPADTEE
jgi:hypothetical protein